MPKCYINELSHHVENYYGYFKDKAISVKYFCRMLLEIIAFGPNIMIFSDKS